VNGVSPLKQQLTAPAICMVLRPGTTGEVLKWNVMSARSDTVQESAGTLFTVKPPGPQPVNGSMGQLTPTEKSVGGVRTMLSQSDAKATTHVSVGVGVGVAVGVGVTVAVGVGVFDGVGVGVGLGVGPSPKPRI
jgi:hypothetical protein